MEGEPALQGKSSSRATFSAIFRSAQVLLLCRTRPVITMRVAGFPTMREILLATLIMSQGAATQADTSSPSAGYREIGHAGTSAICASLRDDISRLVAGAARNDDAIAVGQTILIRMGKASSNASIGDASPDLELDRQRLNRVASVLSHNLAIMQSILRKLAPPAKTSATDAAPSVDLQTHLANVIASQRIILNLVSGTVLTDELGQMQTDYPKDMGPGDFNPGGPPDPSGESNSNSYITVAGLPRGVGGTAASGFTTTQGTGTNPRWSVSSSLAGHTLYDQLIRQVTEQQSAIRSSEEAEVFQITSAVALCKSSP